MAFIRNQAKEKYTVVDSEIFRDKNLSLKAIGLLCFLLSLPDKWEFSENGLISCFEKDKQASVRSGLKELETIGYLIRKKTRDARGKVNGAEWIIRENPFLENPILDNPILDNRPQVNTNRVNTNISNTNLNNNSGKKFSPPLFEEVQAYCKERNNGIDAQQFIDFYTAKNWYIGKNKMKDWKAAVRTWEQRRKSEVQEVTPKYGQLGDFV